MSKHGLDKLCAVAAQIEQQATELQRLGLNDTARLLEMAVLDLNRHVYTSRILRIGAKVTAIGSAKVKAH
jgi:hypothetical protein